MANVKVDSVDKIRDFVYIRKLNLINEKKK